MRALFSCPLAAILVLVLSNSSWAQCPEDPKDLGECDTLHVVPWPEMDTCFIACDFMGECDTTCINDPGRKFPCFFYVPLLITHDSNTYWSEMDGEWVQDSLAVITAPLVWTRTNPSAYCSLSGYWNENAMSPYDPRFPRSIWRHFHPSEFDSNRMAWLAGQFQGLEWSTTVLYLASDSSWYYYGYDSVFTPPHMWLTIGADGHANRRWWEGDRTLLATLTFRIEDTMHVCIDSSFWPPGHRLRLSRFDWTVVGYVPRHNLPLCMWVGPPQLVTSPNGGENWCIGKTEEITWSSDSFPGPAVDIEYSTNAGTSWHTISLSAPNVGTYAWIIPDTPSDRCLVRVSDTDGDPCDESDESFSIFLAGDANGDAVVDVADIIFLINYLFMNGSAPIPLEAGDVNLDGVVDTGDLVYLINFLFLDGAAPRC
jgi:hypothetical protein